MRYQSKSSIAYLFRNFFHLMPIALLPAVALGLFLNTNAEILFAKDFVAGTITQNNVVERFLNAVSLIRFDKYWWGAIVSLVLFVFAESILMVKVERHMRVGEMPLFPLKRACGIFPTVALFVLCVVLCVELLNLIVVGVAFLLRYASAVLVVVVGLILLYLTRILATLAVGALLFAFPIMFLENYSFNNALSYSARLMSENRKYLWFFAAVYPSMRLALTAICYFVNSYAVTVVVFSVFYLFAMLIIPCLTFKLYYDSVGGERRDVIVKMF